MKTNERIEETLEKLWEQLEENTGGNISPEILDPEQNAFLDTLVEKGLVEIFQGGIRFTKTGREEARLAIRRHRLSERLFHDIIETNQDDMEEAACQMEHVVKKEIEEEICRLLGHPETCPHGKPIPAGACCQKARLSGDKFVAPLASLKRGEKGVIAYIKAGDSKKLQKLMAMGILPGNPITLTHAFPSFVFTVGYSQYAVDRDMADAIYVKRGVHDHVK
ncbi:metal-dependent transcriptional regulator [Geobacter hydrogenophilus]|uniref:Transcriptional regulator n=1 Tax=Geobacter hydrogenophilus TaxID=40983 RepID=A0A9W6G397_9BACT|nr:metal-dependent transcriptional regulator [Geobacter hydrogenophilus]MBT0895331.1 metal-dependent transcriptional regulator [Geobacter hydrogenophilus]GLI39557.1 transcriptional regulator [Geobacter hydrogenophilus]